MNLALDEIGKKAEHTDCAKSALGNLARHNKSLRADSAEL